MCGRALSGMSFVFAWGFSTQVQQRADGQEVLYGRCYSHLSAEERGALMVMCRSGQSIRRVATRPWAEPRAPSTLSRELRRNGVGPADGSAPTGRTRTPPGYDAQRARAARAPDRPADWGAQPPCNALTMCPREHRPTGELLAVVHIEA